MVHPPRDSVRSLVVADLQRWAKLRGRKLNFTLFIYLVLLEPGFQFTLGLRLQGLLGSIPFAGKFLRRLTWYILTRSFNCDFGVQVNPGGGLYLPHPFSIVVNGHSVIGRNVTLLQGVTLGIRDQYSGAPTIADDVSVNAGAAIIGGVLIGAGSTIGANAVVLSDVPPNSTAVGVPARSIASRPKSAGKNKTL